MDNPSPPQTEEALIRRLSRDFDSLSKQLKQIGRYIEQHRVQIGLLSIQELARNVGVQPSAVVRFAKYFGYSGFSEMQKLFREKLSTQVTPGRSYQSRIRKVIEFGASNLSSLDIAHGLISGSLAGLEDMQNHLDEESFEKAVNLLADADNIWIVGMRRSFPMAAYLTYALQHTDKRIGLISSVGGMQDGEIRSLRRGDVLVAISFAPYAPETKEVASAAEKEGATILAITDSRLSPIARNAAVSLLVKEHSLFGFRALTNTMALAQSIFLAIAYRLELKYPPDDVTP